MTNNQEAIAWIFILMILKEFKQSSTSPGMTFKLIRGNATSHRIEKVNAEESLQYPRYKRRNFREIKKMWVDYYSCLQKMETRERKPEIRFLLEGQFTEFPCAVCPRPFQNYDELEWKYKPLFLDNDIHDLEYLDLTNEMTLTKKKTLRIFNVVEDFAGLYVCYQKKNVISVYILEVSKNNSMEKVLTPSVKKTTVELNGKNFEIYYRWTQWTECSICNGIGRKYKYGSCFICPKKTIYEKNIPKAVKNESLSRRSVFFFERKKNLLKNITFEDNIYQNYEVEKIGKFYGGIPCASQYLPTVALSHTQKFKQVKVVVKYCLESCEKYQIFQVFDSSGRVIEQANNSAGVYSFFQKIPKLSPDVERRSMTAQFGTNIVIQCPGTLLSGMPVTWKINNQILFPEIIASESRGRFAIDLVNRIHLKKLRLRDSRIYSCWQGNQLIGTVNLTVEKKFRLGLDHHVILVGTVIIIGITLLIGNKLIERELKNRTK